MCWWRRRRAGGVLARRRHRRHEELKGGDGFSRQSQIPFDAHHP